MKTATLVKRLRKRCKEEGQRRVAEQLGIDETILSRILSGDRPPSKEVAAALGLRRVYAFEQADERP